MSQVLPVSHPVTGRESGAIKISATHPSPKDVSERISSKEKGEIMGRKLVYSSKMYNNEKLENKTQTIKKRERQVCSLMK